MYVLTKCLEVSLTQIRIGLMASRSYSQLMMPASRNYDKSQQFRNSSVIPLLTLCTSLHKELLGTKENGSLGK